MLRKKIKKISSVLVAVIIAFSCILFGSFTASAQAGVVYTFPFQEPEADEYSGYLEVLFEHKETKERIVEVYGWRFIVGETYSYSSEGDVDIARYPSMTFTIKNNSITYKAGYSDNNTGNSHNSFTLVTSFQRATGHYEIFSDYFRSEGTYKYLEGIFYEDLYSYNVVGAKFHGNCSVEYNDLYYTNGGAWTIVYGSNNAVFYQLKVLENALKQQNSGIIENQNENTDKIIQNQEENQEELTHGWEQEEEIDTSTTDDYAAKDKELQNSTEQGRSSAVSVFNSFGSLFSSNGHLSKGLLSVSAIFTEFFKVDWLSSLINFSLAIGVFAFVIGTGSGIFKSAHEKYKDNKISKIDSYDERWLM